MRLRTIGALLCALLTNGCVTVADRCANYGFSPGTTAFAECMMTVDQQRRQASAALMASGLQLMSQRPPPPVPAPEPPTTVCRPIGGGQLVCQ